MVKLFKWLVKKPRPLNTVHPPPPHSDKKKLNIGWLGDTQEVLGTTPSTKKLAKSSIVSSENWYIKQSFSFILYIGILPSTQLYLMI